MGWGLTANGERGCGGEVETLPQGEPGYIYVASNPSMIGIVKIGRTRRSVGNRIRELQSTGVPTPFAKEFALHVANTRFVEVKVHRILDRYRVSDNREFFRIDPRQAFDVVFMASLGLVTNADTLPEFARYHDELHQAQRRLFEIEFARLARRTRRWRWTTLALCLPSGLLAAAYIAAAGP